MTLDLLKFDKPDEMAAGVEEFKRMVPAAIEMQKAIAQIRRASYSAHLDAGFEPEQALFLCKSIFPTEGP